MEYLSSQGIIIKSLSGKYLVKLNNSNEYVLCSAKGNFKHKNTDIYVGDTVELDNQSIIQNENDSYRIVKILDRKNSIIRPPLANLSHMFIVIPTINPKPDFLTIDKLISICEYNKIEPIIVINKSDLDQEESKRIYNIYNKGFSTFIVSTYNSDGISKLNDFVNQTISNYKETFIAAFAGVSGAGKSSILTSLFPSLNLASGELSQKIQRGKNTTRHCELFPIEYNNKTGYLADTPGFSMLDFTKFYFFSLEDLPYSFREFVPLLADCKYTDCSHTSEETCGVIKGIKQDKVSNSRHDSYVKIYQEIKKTPDWEKSKLKIKR